ncbi:chromosome segregation protein SMC [Pseudochelatococcus contaminans]|uniref:Chromosome partition protein Smc n=1 Tax=Pseudochelatococcus contaminans TaxID=1538103 RepID=A0A7W6EFI4_9HYPH|nr:chromosome segregation protein SMC [Pseudochelatococcus contaminans]MBB3808864.1 chromosome segregation protein [Pseudochelatococcus contaminans]
MKLNRLRIVGFKTFVEPSEFLIEPGLTGVVGPNGCGKSNLVEALRWVMGESSYKSLRASGMDDVIFGGSSTRPARNSAEVMLTIDNTARTAPSFCNDSDTLEVSRKITRDSGSAYRINGREARARDVQLLFADAATGARSHAMVRQGQIGEIIAAKPQARRRILEDAAGIAGLHSRRHEAELRLRAAEDNLRRLEDVMHEIDGQVDGLRRQARQAGRYRALSADIRRLEAVSLLIAWCEARDQVAGSAAACGQDESAVTACGERQAQTAYAQGIAAHALAQARAAEEATAQNYQNLVQQHARLEAEEKRARERTADAARRIVELERDIVREKAQAQDAGTTIARLRDEDGALAARLEGADFDLAEAAEVVAMTLAALEDADAELARVQAGVADVAARRAELSRRLTREEERLVELTREHDHVAQELAALIERAGPDDVDILAGRAEACEALYEEAESSADAARAALTEARAEEAALRQPMSEAERRVQRIEAEIAALRRLAAPDARGGGISILDMLQVAKGYETALGAALGDDLLAGLDPSAPAHWRTTWPDENDDTPTAAFPPGVEPLSDKVSGPPALERRLRAIGIVDRESGAELQAILTLGQRLVTREGDVWRWDGFTSAADAPSAASRRLEERNRLADLETEAEQAQEEAGVVRDRLDAAQTRIRSAAEAETRTIDARQAARRTLEDARAALTAAERANTATATRRAALEEAVSRLATGRDQAGEGVKTASAELSALPEVDEAGSARARAAATAARGAHGDAERSLQSLQRDVAARRRRRDAIAAELRAWDERAARAAGVLEDIGERLDIARETQIEQTEAAEELLLQHAVAAGDAREAEAAVVAAGEARRAAETALVTAETAARAALDALSAAREARARSQAVAEAAQENLVRISHRIADALGIAPEQLRAHAGIEEEAEIPAADAVENDLVRLRQERERLGAVNLRAEEELAQMQDKREGIGAEHDELTEAIRRLRTAIGNLNREGRERLLAAFSEVNTHFQHLFTLLFGGGTAELTLIDSDDPLEAGLEIYARPPGKKPQVLTLLSGGEQALTAIALIFAVFLTNPSPVCVLDEVDAPLDDANVERYCALLRDMVERTQTRFIVITHNPITMAAMDRLFGVTMAEKGISQLVSVDLAVAETIREAG